MITDYVRSQLLASADAKDAEAIFHEQGLKESEGRMREARGTVRRLRIEAVQLRKAARHGRSEEDAA